MKKFACGQVVPGCDGVVTGATDDDVVAAIAAGGGSSEDGDDAAGATTTAPTDDGSDSVQFVCWPPKRSCGTGSGFSCQSG